MFKFKITLDRHNLELNLNDDLLPDPPLFSLPSTFKKVTTSVCIFIVTTPNFQTAHCLWNTNFLTEFLNIKGAKESILRLWLHKPLYLAGGMITLFVVPAYSPYF